MNVDSSFTAQLLQLTTQLHEQACLLDGLIPSEPGSNGRAISGDGVEVDARKLKETIKDVAFEVYSLCLEPEEVLRGYATHAHLLSLHFIQRFKIARIVPTDAEDEAGIAFEEIAVKCGQRPSTVRRMLRHALGLGIFKEVNGCVWHTPASLLLRRDSYASWMASTCEESWPAATKTVDALEQYPTAEEPTESGWSLAKMPGLSLYDGISRSPERATRFAKGMEAYSSGNGYDAEHFIGARSNFLSALPDGSCFVDVGGGRGQFSHELQKHFGHLRFVVQDLEGTIRRASNDLCDLGLSLSGGNAIIENKGLIFMAYDFFQPQPIVGAAVYFLRWICHNWSDKYAVRILRHVAAAMTANSRLIIHDYCIDDDLNQASLLKRRQMTAMDLGMLQLLNARERTSREWEALLVSADPRFEWMGVTKPKGSSLAIIEAGWRGEYAIP